MTATLQRLLRGDYFRGPYIPHRTPRCRVGLHLWIEVWEPYTLGEDDDGFSPYAKSVTFNCDRPSDYVRCARCAARKHDRKLAHQLPRL